jgi:hypothetical protein
MSRTARLGHLITEVEPNMARANHVDCIADIVLELQFSFLRILEMFSYSPSMEVRKVTLIRQSWIP